MAVSEHPLRPAAFSQQRATVARGTGWAGVVGGKALFAALTILYIWIVEYLYVDVIAATPIFRGAGITAFDPIPWTRSVAFFFAAIPLTWLRRDLRSVSDPIVTYIYFTAYIPSCILLPFTSEGDFSAQLFYLSLLFAAMALVEVRRRFSSLDWTRFSLRREFDFELVLYATIGTMLFLMVFLGQIDLGNLSFFDVYERRASLQYEGGVGSLLFYLSNWAGLSIAPLAIVFGLNRRNYVLVGLGALLALVAFAATSFKSNLFVSVLCLLAYLAATLLPRRTFGLSTVIGLLSICFVCFAADALFNHEPIVTWTVEFRMIGNNGFLTAKYFDFFSEMPKNYFADSFGRFFYESEYNRPVAQVIGESFSSIAGVHANANLWADGYANLGVAGILFAVVELLVVILLFETASRGKHLLIIAPLTISMAFSVANISVHSMMISNGGLLTLIFVVLMPKLSDLKDRKPFAVG